MPNLMLNPYGLASRLGIKAFIMALTANAVRSKSLQPWALRLMTPRAKLALSVLAVCVAYYIGALAAKTFRFPSSHLSLIWPPTAILLATLLLAQKRQWWIFLLAAAPVHIVVQLQDAVPFLGVLSQLLGNFGQALLAAAIMCRVVGEPPHFNQCRGMVAFILGAAILSPLMVSTLAAYLYVLSGWEENYAYAVKARVFSNVLSTLTIAPAIVCAVRELGQNRKIDLRRMAEAGLLGCAFVILAVTVFDSRYKVPISLYAPVPLLLWAAVRFGVGGLSFFILVTAYLAFLQASDGAGPFIAESAEQNMLSMQLFLIVISMPSMLLAAAIEERRSKEAALSESEARYRALVVASADAVWRTNEKGDRFMATSAWEDLTGQSEEQMRDFGWLAVVHPEDRERTRQLWHQAVSARHVYENELRVQTRNGGYRHFHSYAVPIIDPAGTVLEWVGADTDITQRKQAEMLRAGQSRMLEMIATNAPLKKVLDSLARFVESQSSGLFCSVLFLDDNGVQMRHGAAPSLPGSYTQPLDGIAIGPKVGSCGTAMYQGKPIIVTDILADPLWDDYRDLAVCHGLRACWSHPIVSSQGKMLGSFAMYYSEPRSPTAADTELINLAVRIAAIGIERDRAQEALRNSEERLRLALEAGRMGVWDWDKTANVLRWSKEKFNILGLEPFSVEPDYLVWSERVHPEDRAEVDAAMKSAIAGRKEFEREYRIVRPDGALRWVESRGHPIYDEEGRCIRMMGLILDVTERKQSEQALQSVMAELHRLKEIAEAENIYLREEVFRVHRFGEIIGRSEAILSVLKQAEQVAPTDTTALILGETGTGKELLARAIHARSKRNERPLVTVNCAALPASLIESELFGHERGAFTGAAGKRIGRFEFADGATIFLDEIGELPLELQAKLLRVLQDGEFERLGSSKTIKVNVRVIAATNRDLRRAIQERKFREDLYYRLNVYPIHIPPLRERKEDIGALAMEFVAEAGQRLGRSFDPILRDVLDQLQAYDWPGNARELQNVIERAALVSPGRRLHLPEHWTPGCAQQKYETAASAGEAENDAELASLEELERSHVLRVLRQTHWRIEGAQGAAAILRINPSTLRSRMNKLGIRRFETIPARRQRGSDGAITRVP